MAKLPQEILDTIFNEGYKKGKSDMLDSIIRAEKNKYYCDEELCGESKDCSDCMVRYLEQLKKGQNNGK